MSCVRQRLRLFHQVRKPVLLVLGALSISCGSRKFALGEGRDCDEGTLNCICDNASGCEGSLLCREDLCVDPNASEQENSTATSSTSDPQLPSGHGPGSTTKPGDTTSAECTNDSDCAALDKPCYKASCEAGTCSTSPLPDQSACTDLEHCIPQGSCKQGSCQGKVARFLAEDFSAGKGQWRVTSQNDIPSNWQVGPAKASACDDAGRGEDPKEDHSPSGDNNLAGTSIGGCLKGRSNRTWDCLMSPEMDISKFKGKLEFSYWRHLHSPPKIVQGLDGVHYRVFAVFNGKTPAIVEEGYDAGIDDKSWQRSSHLIDVDDTSLTVSFCFKTGYGARDFAGWSVDDIRVRAQGCDSGL